MLREGDNPLPRSIEEDAIRLQTVIRLVTSMCIDGRPIDKKDWVRFRAITYLLSNELEDVDLSFDEI